VPVTHDMLDQLAPADRTCLLRMILVDAHVLPERDEQLAALERWVSQFLETADPGERRLGRNSALMDLAAQMPPAVLSEVLGISIGAATGWAAAAGAPSAQHAAALSRRSKSGDQGRMLAVTLSKNGDHGVSE
jgi:hypothetical protein